MKLFSVFNVFNDNDKCNEIHIKKKNYKQKTKKKNNMNILFI